jgi:hypothetical protein
MAVRSPGPEPARRWSPLLGHAHVESAHLLVARDVGHEPNVIGEAQRGGLCRCLNRGLVRHRGSRVRCSGSRIHRHDHDGFFRVQARNVSSRIGVAYLHPERDLGAERNLRLLRSGLFRLLSFITGHNLIHLLLHLLKGRDGVFTLSRTRQARSKGGVAGERLAGCIGG